MTTTANTAARAAIGAAEEAQATAAETLTKLHEAADCAEDEGYASVAAELRELWNLMDDVANRIGLQREALR